MSGGQPALEGRRAQGQAGTSWYGGDADRVKAQGEGLLLELGHQLLGVMAWLGSSRHHP